MKPSLTRRVRLLPVAGVWVFLALGCQSSGGRGTASPGTVPLERPLPAASTVQGVVEEYIRAATAGDGAKMYALIASSERDDESPESLGDTARDRYSPQTRWEVLKAEASGNTGVVVVDFQGAKVDPNPTRFTLTRENREWRIVDSPELHEREKRNGLRLDL